MYQKKGLGLSNADIAKNLCVDQSTVKRILQLWYDTGNVSKKVYCTSDVKVSKKITKVVEFFILHLVLQNAGIMLREIRDEVNNVLQVELHNSTICRFLKSQRFTRQKMQIIARQRDEVERAIYREEISIYKKEMLIFVDESGFDRRNALRKYAYNWRG